MRGKFVSHINCITMKKLLFSMLILPAAMMAQVGINTATPMSVFDIRSSNQAAPTNADGILIPKIDAFPTTNPTTSQVGLMVFLTTAVGTNSPGFYYWTVGGWRGVGTSTSWSFEGNSGTTSAHFVGTTDNMPLNFRVRDVPSGKIDSISKSTFFGYESGRMHTAASGNTGFGYKALKRNTTGEQNVAVGAGAMNVNVSGYANTAVGYAALFANTGNRNTAIGHGALNRNTTGNENSGTGWGALILNTTGWYNTAHGSLCLTSNTTGSNNTAMGYGALNLNVTGSYNSTYGVSAGLALPNNVNNVTCLGYYSGFSTTPTNHINIGNGSVAWIGGQVNFATFSDARTKENISENVKGLEFIKKLRPVTYNFNYNKEYELLNEGRKDTAANYPGKYDIEKILFSGFIAQEAERAAQQSGYDFSGIVPPPNGKGAYTVRYAEFVVPLVKAVQEQQQEIEALKRDIEEIKALLQNGRKE